MSIPCYICGSTPEHETDRGGFCSRCGGKGVVPKDAYWPIKQEFNMDPNVKRILAEAVDRLHDEMCSSGCNDYYVKPSEEVKALWDEGQKHNSSDPTEWQPFPNNVNGEGEVCVNDWFQLYVLKKYLGLL